MTVEILKKQNVSMGAILKKNMAKNNQWLLKKMMI